MYSGKFFLNTIGFRNTIRNVCLVLDFNRNENTIGPSGRGQYFRLKEKRLVFQFEYGIELVGLFRS